MTATRNPIKNPADIGRVSVRPFRKGYIDAFTGTGYRDARREDEPTSNLLLPDLAENEPRELLDGSARLALKTEPPFEKHMFIAHALQVPVMRSR